MEIERQGNKIKGKSDSIKGERWRGEKGERDIGILRVREIETDTLSSCIISYIF